MAPDPTRLHSADGDLVIRRADSADVTSLVALVESAYRGESSTQGWTTEEHLLGGQRTDTEQVAGLFSGADSVVLAAELPEAGVVGCCHLERRGDRAYFGMFAVDPQRQGGGLGRRIVRAAEECAASTWQATHLEMTVIRQRTDLIAWYLRLGFIDTGIRSPFPYGDERFGIPRVDDLEFTLLEKTLA